MKVVAITGKHQAGLVERPDPKIKEDFVRVKILVAPMCTEYKSFDHGDVTDTIGHEAAGEVVEIAQPGWVKVGDRVVVMPQYPCGKCDLCLRGDYIHCEHTINPLQFCDSPTGTATYAQYMIKQDWLLIPIPDDMSYEHAAMACCGLGPTFGAMQYMQVDRFDTLLVMGLGPVGLGAVINGVYRGARVIGVDPQPYRARLAKELGASAVIDPTDPEALKQIKRLTGGLGVDKTVECTAVPAAQKLSIEATRRRGQVTFVGWGGHIELDNMIPQGLTLQGCWHWNLRDTPRIMQTIRACRDLIDRQITHTFPMSRVMDAWDLQLSGNCGKVLLKPWE
jgi:L-iditol 2-dehydrogenase